MKAAVAAASIATPDNRDNGDEASGRHASDVEGSPRASPFAGSAGRGRCGEGLHCVDLRDSCLDVSARETTHDPILGFTPVQ